MNNSYTSNHADVVRPAAYFHIFYGFLQLENKSFTFPHIILKHISDIKYNSLRFYSIIYVFYCHYCHDFRFPQQKKTLLS